MPVTEYLERNARLYPDEVALVELNPDEPDTEKNFVEGVRADTAIEI